MKKVLALGLLNGFTLIELLIVISIIGILVTFVSASYTGAQKQARDTQRRSDLGQYKIALENYAASNNGYYVGHLNAMAPWTIHTTNMCSVSTTTISLMGYMADNCLKDPRQTDTSNHICASGSDDYNYCYTEDGATTGPSAKNYLLSAQLETGGYWIICSNGKTGKSATRPAGVTCPL